MENPNLLSNLRLVSWLDDVLGEDKLEIPRFDKSVSRSSTSVIVLGDRMINFPPGFWFGNGGSLLALTCLVGEDIKNFFYNLKKFKKTFFFIFCIFKM